MFPQTQSEKAVLAGQEYWRLLTDLESSGDIYRMVSSARAFVIGPQSDLAAVRVTYMDPVSGLANDLIVSVDDPFVGRVDAANEQQFAGLATPGRMLISPYDLFEPTFLPSNYAVGDLVAFYKPRIDLLGYLGDPAGLPARRADRSILGTLSIIDRGAGTGVTHIMVPFYGRKYASVKAVNYSGAASFDMITSLVTFTRQGGSRAQVDLLDTTTLGATIGAFDKYVSRASVNGLADFLLVQFSGNAIDGTATGTILYTIQVSDQEA